jgi:hypothetical protein
MRPAMNGSTSTSRRIGRPAARSGGIGGIRSGIGDRARSLADMRWHGRSMSDPRPSTAACASATGSSTRCAVPPGARPW